MRLYILFTLVLLGVTNMFADKERNQLSDLKWKYRVLLINSPESQYLETKKALLQAKEAIDERQIAWFLYTGKGRMIFQPDALMPDPGHFLNHVKGTFFPEKSKFSIVLIGKDGWVKRRLNSLDLDAVFALIDTMPMRRTEMREQAESVK